MSETLDELGRRLDEAVASGEMSADDAQEEWGAACWEDTRMSIMAGAR